MRRSHRAWSLAAIGIGNRRSRYDAVAENISVMAVISALDPRPFSFALEALEIALDRSEGFVAVRDDLHGELARMLGLRFHDKLAVFSSGLKEEHVVSSICGCHGYLSNCIMFIPELAHANWQAEWTPAYTDASSL